MTQTRNETRPGRNRRAFTILELMVAVAIVIILTILTVPTFRAVQANLNASSAENTLSAVLNQARNMAMRGGTGDHGDTAVIFLYDRETQRYSLLVASQRIEGIAYGGSPPPANDSYDIFAPIEGTRQRDLPPGWEVRGLGYGANVGANSRWYDHDAYYGSEDADIAWIFPESDDAFQKRQTFMVRFAAQSGAVITSNEQFRSQEVWLYLNPLEPLDEIDRTDPTGWMDTVFGNGVHVRPVPALAVYSVDELVEVVTGIDIDPGTGTLYGSDYIALAEGDGSYLDGAIYQAANGDTYDDYEALFYYLDENTDPIVFNRFTGMIMRNRPQ